MTLLRKKPEIGGSARWKIKFIYFWKRIQPDPFVKRKGKACDNITGGSGIMIAMRTSRGCGDGWHGAVPGL